MANNEIPKELRQQIADFIAFLAYEILIDKGSYILINDIQNRRVKLKLKREHIFTYDLIDHPTINATQFAAGVLSKEDA